MNSKIIQFFLNNGRQFFDAELRKYPGIKPVQIRAVLIPRFSRNSLAMSTMYSPDIPFRNFHVFPKISLAGSKWNGQKINLIPLIVDIKFLLHVEPTKTECSPGIAHGA